MRVIAGTAKSIPLKTLDGSATRPTTDRVKESVFSALQFDIEGASVLDLFAGSGQLGIEALSRGAKKAFFIDASPAAVKIVKENLKKTRLDSQASVFCSDSLSYLKNCREQFDIIFLDPPYAGTLLAEAIRSINSFDILAPDGIIVAETHKDYPLTLPEGLQAQSRTYGFGICRVTIIRTTSN